MQTVINFAHQYGGIFFLVVLPLWILVFGIYERWGAFTIIFMILISVFVGAMAEGWVKAVYGALIHQTLPAAQCCRFLI